MLTVNLFKAVEKAEGEMVLFWHC